MYKLCKTEQSAARQRELEMGLLAAMGTHRYEEISVSDLCDQMGIPRKAFYRYFSSKDGALHALIDHTLLEFGGFSAGQPPKQIQTYQKDLEEFFGFWKSQKPLLDALARSGISGELVIRAVGHALSDTDSLRAFQPQNEKIIQEQAINFAVCGLMSMALNWHQNGFQPDVEQMAEIAVRMLTKPLFVNPNR